MMTALQSEVNATVHMLDTTIRELFDLLKDAQPDDLEVRDALTCRAYLNEVSGSLMMVRKRLDTLIGDALGDFETVVDGIGVVRRHQPVKRTDWKSDDLLRVVLDTRRVDQNTGEIESDVDKIKHVYPLAGYQARLTALKERGIDPDDYCIAEKQPGWTLEVK